MTDDDPERAEDADGEESSLRDLVASIEDREGENAASPDEDSLDDLLESIEGRRDDDDAPDDDASDASAGTGFTWIDDRDAARTNADRDLGPAGDADETGSSLRDLAGSLDKARGDDADTVDDGGASSGAAGGARAIDAIEDDSSVLFLGPLASSRTDRHCVDLLTPTAPAVENVLLVTVTQSADDRLSMWREHADVTPETMKVVTVGDAMRSAGEPTEVTMSGTTTDITISNVPDPSDLARLGITLTRTLSDWDGSHGRICFHSLTALLQYVDPQHLFRFLHVLRGKSDSLEVAAHYHMDPEAHENQTIRLFTSLFDTVVRLEDDGSLSIASGD